MARIYLAPDDEITSVIEKLRNTEDKHIVLVVPKGTALMQSVINIRLLKKKADELKKVLGIVAPDSISKHLAAQVGLAVYDAIEDVPKEDKVPIKKAASIPATPEPVIHLDEAAEQSKSDVKHQSINGVTIKQYERTHDTTAALKEVPVETAASQIAAQDEDLEETDQEQAAPVDDVHDQAEELASDVIIGKQMAHIEEHEHEHHHRSHLKPARRPLHIPRYMSIVGFVLVLVVLISGIAYAAMVPRATITLHVPAESIKKTVVVTVDPRVSSVDATIIPGLKYEATSVASAEAKATGKKDVGEKAKGTVTISNSWDSESQTLAKNTALQSASGLVFRTTAEVVVPGLTSTVSKGQIVINPGKADVAVEAADPGDQYNVGATTFKVQGFSGDKQAKITGANAKAISGGTTKQLTVVATADIDQAKNQAKTNSEAASKVNLKQAVPKEELLLDKTVSVSSEAKEANHAAGDEASAVSANASSQARGLSMRMSDVASVLNNIFKDGLAPAKSIILPNLETIMWDVKSKDNGVYELSKEIEGQIITAVDANSVQRFVTRKQVSSIADSLKQQFGAKEVEIQVTPARWPFMPMMHSKITVNTTE